MENIIFDTNWWFRYLKGIELEDNNKKIKEIFGKAESKLILAEFVFDEVIDNILVEVDLRKRGQGELHNLPEFYFKKLFTELINDKSKFKFIRYCRESKDMQNYRSMGKMEIIDVIKYFNKERKIDPADMGLLLSLKDINITKFKLFSGDLKFINALEYSSIKDYIKSLGFEIETIPLRQSNGRA